MQRGETLWRIARDFGWDVQDLANANRIKDPERLTPGQLLFIPTPPETDRFIWPARGQLASVKGTSSESTRGLDIKAPEGSFVRAARSGRVAVATRQLSGWGKTVILDHGDGYLTVYSGLGQLLVSPGTAVRQGNPIGRLGQESLHFEIRYGASPRNPWSLLP